MRYAYADPPYPGQAKRYDTEAGADGRISREVNHRLLVAHLCDGWPDGWALSTNASTLQQVLALCPDDVRIGAWCKPFAVFRPGVNPGYCWEPVIFRGGRKKRERAELTVRDYLIEPVQLNGGVLRGAKPARFTHWICDLLGVQQGDTVDDLFPGTGAVSLAIDGFLGRTPTAPDTLFGVSA